MSAEKQTTLLERLARDTRPHGTCVAPAVSLSGDRCPPVHPWSLERALGQFVELTGGARTAALTVCAGLILETQQHGGLTGWIGSLGSIFYPPDLADSGVDLAALAVVHVGEGEKLWRACDTLLRSGGFRLVVLDLDAPMGFPLPVQTRLAGLAKHYHAALIALTRESRRHRPRGSFVSLRLETELRRAGHDCFVCEAQALKDKRGAPGWKHWEMCRGTDGVC